MPRQQQQVLRLGSQKQEEYWQNKCRDTTSAGMLATAVGMRVTAGMPKQNQQQQGCQNRISNSRNAKTELATAGMPSTARSPATLLGRKRRN
jgi:hypothetical protein